MSTSRETHELLPETYQLQNLPEATNSSVPPVDCGYFHSSSLRYFQLFQHWTFLFWVSYCSDRNYSLDFVTIPASLRITETERICNNDVKHIMKKELFSFSLEVIVEKGLIGGKKRKKKERKSLFQFENLCHSLLNSTDSNFKGLFLT